MCFGGTRDRIAPWAIVFVTWAQMTAPMAAGKLNGVGRSLLRSTHCNSDTQRPGGGRKLQRQLTDAKITPMNATKAQVNRIG